MFSYKTYKLHNVFRRSFRKILSLKESSAVLASESCDNSKNMTSTELKKKKKPPFIKNLLLGVYDIDILSFPEVLDNEKLKFLEGKHFAIKNVVTETDEAVLFPTILKFINTEKTSNEYSSSTTLVTELTKLSESVPSARTVLLLEINQIFGTNLLETYGTKEQKEKYLPGLLSGKISASYALSEESTGSDPTYLSTVAYKKKDAKTWKLNGTKTWVSNAQNANILFIFSKSKYIPGPERNELSVFIVEKNSEGVTIEPQSPVGLEDCGIAKINFNNVLVEDENVLGNVGKGYTIASDFLSNYKLYLASYFSRQLKQFLSNTLEFILPRKQSSGYLKDLELIRNDICTVASVIYSLESMMYILSGMKDTYDIDTSLESAIIQVYLIEEGLKAFETCMMLLGSRAFDNSLPYEKQYRDLKGLAISLQSKNITKLFIALSGLQYAGQNLSESVKKIRNSLNFPAFAIKKIMSNYKNSRDSPQLNLALYTNLHPTLRVSADKLEYCVLRLNYAVELLLTRHGSEVVNRQLDLERITNILSDVFAMTAVLSRASHSYCTGIQFCNEEILLATSICEDAYQRCKLNLLNVIDGAVISNDLSHLKIGDDIIKNKGYFIEHPLVRNIS